MAVYVFSDDTVRRIREVAETITATRMLWMGGRPMTEQQWLESGDPAELFRELTRRTPLGGDDVGRDPRFWAATAEWWRAWQPHRIPDEEVAKQLEAEGGDSDTSTLWFFDLCNERKSTVAYRTLGADLLRCAYGNPFLLLTAHYRDWTSFLTPTVRAVAGTVLAERRWDELPLLADALEEAGCPAEVPCPTCSHETMRLVPKAVSRSCPLCRGSAVTTNPVIDHLRGVPCSYCRELEYGGTNKDEDYRRRFVEYTRSKCKCRGTRRLPPGPHCSACWVLRLCLPESPQPLILPTEFTAEPRPQPGDPLVYDRATATYRRPRRGEAPTAVVMPPTAGLEGWDSPDLINVRVLGDGEEGVGVFNNDSAAEREPARGG